jgi:hypothetical protein
MARVTSEQAADKLIRRLSVATEDIRTGVEQVTVAPTQKAAAKIDKMRANLLAAFDNGKVKRGLERVTLEQWKSQMLNKGIPRVAAGVQEARPKLVEFYNKLLPFQDRVKAEITKMPDVTLEDNINRMTTFVRGMAKFQR